MWRRALQLSGGRAGKFGQFPLFTGNYPDLPLNIPADPLSYIANMYTMNRKVSLLLTKAIALSGALLLGMGGAGPIYRQQPGFFR
jgi:hypothetical protein